MRSKNLCTHKSEILDDNGIVVPLISKENFDSVSRHFKESKTADVTGAMAGKIRELLELDTPSYIVNGLKFERLEALMLWKEAECTEIRQIRK